MISNYWRLFWRLWGSTRTRINPTPLNHTEVTTILTTTVLMVMTICLVVYAALEYRTRNALAKQRRTVPDQKGRPTNRPTMRWVFQFFAGIHRLLIDGQATVMMNLKVAQLTVIEVLGRPYRLIYGGGGGGGRGGAGG